MSRHLQGWCLWGDQGSSCSNQLKSGLEIIIIKKNCIFQREGSIKSSDFWMHKQWAARGHSGQTRRTLTYNFGAFITSTTRVPHSGQRSKVPCINIRWAPGAAWLGGMDQLHFLLMHVSSGTVDLSVPLCWGGSPPPPPFILYYFSFRDWNDLFICMLHLFHSLLCFNTLMCLPARLCVFGSTDGHQIAKLLSWYFERTAVWIF